MADDARPRYKTRSASICAPASTSLENVLAPPSGSGTPDSGTPGYRRRRPATRSQSARMTGGRSVRRRVQTHQPNLVGSRSHCNSEPKLNDTETPPQRRRGSQRRPQHTQSQRKSNAFLDVPSINIHHLQVSDPDDDDNYRLRTFSSSKGGVINRGDSFRRRRSRSNSLAPTSPMKGPDEVLPPNPGPVETFLVMMMGSTGVGKAALVSQFRTSECINAYEGPEASEEQNISIILNGMESELKFLIDCHGNKSDLEQADAFLVVFSVVDKSSYSRAEQTLNMLHDMDLLRSRAVVLVANKIDLARSRAVSAQDGKCLACTYRTKFIEVSVGINHNVDELLAGCLTQIRLKKEQNYIQGHDGSSAHWYKNRSVVRASMKARQMLTWILGKEDSKFKHCENLQVL